MRTPLRALCAAAVLGSAALTPALAAPARDSITLQGAGSSFAAPFFTKAFDVYKSQKGTSVNYQPIGSGGGIRALTAKTVDFGASDVPMAPGELAAAEEAGGPVVQIPVTLGGVSIAYNVKGVGSGLHLTGSVLADIYLGRIKRWNDKAIKSLNKKAHLPDAQITVVHRSDSSGTSYIFSDYLSSVSYQWSHYVGTSKLPNWPVGVGGSQNTGVAQLVSSTPNSIGYIELAYVRQNHMSQAALQNRKKQFEVPNLKTVAAAAASRPKVSANAFSIVNSKGKNAYPIAGYTWLMLFQHQSDKAKARSMVALFNWTVTKGQSYAKGIDYVPLPKNIQKADLAALKKVK